MDKRIIEYTGKSFTAPEVFSGTRFLTKVTKSYIDLDWTIIVLETDNPTEAYHWLSKNVELYEAKRIDDKHIMVCFENQVDAIAFRMSL